MTPENDLQRILRWSLWLLSTVYLTGIILLFTPYTHNVDEIKVAILYVGGGVLWLLYGVYLYHTPHPVRNTPVLLPLLGFLLIFLVAVLASPWRWIGWEMLGFFLFTMSMLFIAVSTVTNFERLIQVCSVFVLLALLSCAFGYFHYLGGFTFITRITPPRHGDEINLWYNLFNTLAQNQREMFGTILNTDFFAAYLVMALPACFTLMFTAPQFGNRLLGFITAIAMAGCIYLSQSNDTMIAVLVFLLIFLFGYLINVSDSILHRHWKFFVLMIAVWSLTLVLLTWHLLVDRYVHIGGAFSSRGIMWAGAWQMFLDRPLLGWGPGSYRIMFPIYRDYDYWLNEISNVTLSPHNQYLDLPAEEGIFGFIFFSWFLLAMGYTLIAEIRKRPPNPMKVVQFSFLAGIAGIQIQNFFSPNYRWVAPATAYYLMLGLAVAAGQITKIEFGGEREPSRLERWLAARRRAWTLGVVLAACVALTYYPSFGVRYFKSALYNNLGMLRMDEGENYNQQQAQAGAKDAEAIRARRDQKYREATEFFTRAINANPTFLTAQYKLAHAFNTRGMRMEAIQAYNDLSHFNPEYSEIHYNYGVIYRVLYIEQYQLDREVLREYVTTIAERKNIPLVLNLDHLTSASQLTAQEQQQLGVIVRSINRYDRRLRDLQLTRLIVPGAEQYDPLLLELSLHHLAIAAGQAHKPLTWLTYIQTLEESGRLDEAIQALVDVFSDKEKETGHVPIHEWKRDRSDSFSVFRAQFIALQLMLYQKTKDYETLLEKLQLRIGEDPNDLQVFKFLLEMYAAYAPDKYQTINPLIAEQLRRQPLSWRLHQTLAQFYEKIGQSSLSVMFWLRAIKLAEHYPESKFQPAVAAEALFKNNRMPNPVEMNFQLAQLLMRMSQKTAQPELKTLLFHCATHFMRQVLDAPQYEEHQKINQILRLNAQNALKALDALSTATRATSPPAP